MSETQATPRAKFMLFALINPLSYITRANRTLLPKGYPAVSEGGAIGGGLWIEHQGQMGGGSGSGGGQTQKGGPLITNAGNGEGSRDRGVIVAENRWLAIYPMWSLGGFGSGVGVYPLEKGADNDETPPQPDTEQPRMLFGGGGGLLRFGLGMHLKLPLPFVAVKLMLGLRFGYTLTFFKRGDDPDATPDPGGPFVHFLAGIIA